MPADCGEAHADGDDLADGDSARRTVADGVSASEQAEDAGQGRSHQQPAAQRGTRAHVQSLTV